MINDIEVADSIADTIAKGSKPLTEAQHTLMVGALVVWLEKARQDIRICKVCKGTGKHRAHNWTANTKELRDCYACEAPSTKRKVR